MVLKHKIFDDFWIITSDFDLEVRQRKVKDIYQAEICSQFSSAEKNTSLLFLREMKSIDLNEEDTYVIAMENDPFFFKKYVLSYTIDAFEKVCQLILSQGEVKCLSEILTNGDTFQKLKDENEYGMYHFLYSLAHKLPFFFLEVHHRDFVGGKPQLLDAEKLLLAEVEGIDKENKIDFMSHIIQKEVDDENQSVENS